MKITIDLDPKTGEKRKVSYRPGLHWNEKSEAVFEAAARLEAAVLACQAEPHDPHYGGV